VAACPLSLYVHVPFCESLCYYCACQQDHHKHHSRGRDYLGLLAREIELHVAELAAGRACRNCIWRRHATFLSDEELSELMALVRQGFRILPQCETSIESIRAPPPRAFAPPRRARLQPHQLRHPGLRPEVQAAVHRIQPFDMCQS